MAFNIYNLPSKSKEYTNLSLYTLFGLELDTLVRQSKTIFIFNSFAFNINFKNSSSPPSNKSTYVLSVIENGLAICILLFLI